MTDEKTNAAFNELRRTLEAACDKAAAAGLTNTQIVQVVSLTMGKRDRAMRRKKPFLTVVKDPK